MKKIISILIISLLSFNSLYAYDEVCRSNMEKAYAETPVMMNMMFWDLSTQIRSILMGIWDKLGEKVESKNYDEKITYFNGLIDVLNSMYDQYYDENNKTVWAQDRKAYIVAFLRSYLRCKLEIANREKRKAEYSWPSTWTWDSEIGWSSSWTPASADDDFTDWSWNTCKRSELNIYWSCPK